MAKKIVDLTNEMYDEMPGWPTHPGFYLEKCKICHIDNYRVTNIRMNTHHGTHLDAPSHFLEKGKTLSDLPIERFVGEGVVVDFSEKGDSEEITKDDLMKYDSEIKKGEFLFLYTGWDKYRGYNDKYLYKWPSLSVDGAEYVRDKGVTMIGIEGLSIEGWGCEVPRMGPINKTLGQVHNTLLSADIIIVEEMKNLDKVLDGKKTARAEFYILPLKLRGVDGSPVRAIAVKE